MYNNISSSGSNSESDKVTENQNEMVTDRIPINMDLDDGDRTGVKILVNHH